MSEIVSPIWIPGQPRLRCAVVGTGPPILIVHGITDDSDCWLGVATRLAAAGFQVIVPDLRGHGESEPSTDGYRIANFADDIARTASAVLDEPAIVCGHSMGARALLHLASSSSAAVIRQAIFLDPPFRTKTPTEPAGTGEAERRYHRFSWLRELRASGWDTAWNQRRGLSPSWSDEAVSTWLRSKMRVSEAIWGPLGPEVATPDWRESLHAIAAPIATITGDPAAPAIPRSLMDPQSIADLRAVPGMDLAMIAGAGHILALDAPERVAAAIAAMAQHADTEPLVTGDRG